MLQNVLTLVAAPELNSAAIETATKVLRQAGAQVESPQWLAAGSACDLAFDTIDPRSAESRVRQALGEAPIDLAAQPEIGRRKRLLVADMESTVIRNEMLDELAEFAGVRSRVERITARAMAGELGFEGALRERVALLKGLPESVLETALERIVIDPGARSLVATMAANDALTAIVSGGFDVFTEPVRRRLGFDLAQANTLLIEGGRLTGEVGEPILGRDAKVRILDELVQQQEISRAEVVAVGDGSNDLAMIAAAGFGVGFHAKPAVIAAARWTVRHGDLRTLLYFQGFRQAEFVHQA